jgi:glycosyltransferase involved in cell wall biosynthesis
VTPLRLTVFVDQFPELTETFIASELHALRDAGHRVVVESVRSAPNPNRVAAEGLAVAYADREGRRTRWPALAWVALRHPLRALADVCDRGRWKREEDVRPLRAVAPAARRAARHGSVHLHAHFGAGAALDALRVSRLLGVPYSVATHGYDIFLCPANLREKHERAAFAVSASDYSVEHVRRLVGPREGTRIHRIVTGVDGERFRRRTPHPEGGTVVAVARLVEKKGLPYLVEAAAQLGSGGPLDRVLVVGDGPLRGALDRLIATTRAPVDLLGARPPEDVRELLERADLVAMPCVVARDGDRDTMPVVVKEALAMEVPVVGTAEVGLPEVVSDGWGRLVPPRDSGALADAIRELLELAPEERAAMGRAGRAFVLEHCDVRRETARLVELIEEAGRTSRG